MQFLKHIFSKNKSSQHQQEMKSYNPYMSLTSHIGAAKWSQNDYHSLCQKGFMINPIMYSCVRMIADGASRVPVIITKNEKIIQSHPLINVIKHPSSDVNGRMFKTSLFSNLLLSGNAYIDCVIPENGTHKGPIYPQALFNLRNDRIQCVTDKKGSVIGYEYRANAFKKYYPAARMIHLKFFAPHDDYYGFSPSMAAWRAVELHNEATIFQKALLDNAARPSGCLVYNGEAGARNLTEGQLRRLRSELRDHYAGALQAGRPMILDGGLEWKSMSLSPHDMGIATMRHDAAREIALAYGIPPMLLGIPGDNTYSNYQEAIRVYTRNCLVPLAELFYEALSDKISRLSGEAWHIEIDRPKVAEMFIDYLS